MPACRCLGGAPARSAPLRAFCLAEVAAAPRSRRLWRCPLLRERSNLGVDGRADVLGNGSVRPLWSNMSPRRMSAVNSSGPSESNGHGASLGAGPIGENAVGVVVIGRNEGERLKRCLRSLIDQGAGPIVYVDSGSSDDSVAFSRSLGVHVVNLDTSIPFTMARG